MLKKKIVKLLKTEGSKFVPNSFSKIEEAIKSSDKYIENQMRFEIDNALPSGKKIVKKHKAKIIKKKYFSPKLIAAYSVGLVVLITATVIPFIPGLFDGEIVNATASPTIITLLSNSYQIDNEFPKRDLIFSYQIDETGLTDINSYLPKTDNSRMTLALLAKDAGLNSQKPDDIAALFIDKAVDSNLVNEKTNEIKVVVNSYSKDLSTILVSEIEKDIKACLNENNLNYTVITETVFSIVDDEIETDIMNKAIDLKENVDYLFTSRPHEIGGQRKLVKGFYPLDNENNAYDLHDYANFVKNNEIYADSILSLTDEMKLGIGTSEDLNKFQNDLDLIYDLYSDREDILKDMVSDYRKEIEELKREYSSYLNDDSFLSDDAYDVELENIEIGSGSSYWWNNNFKALTIDDLGCEFSDWWVKYVDVNKPDIGSWAKTAFSIMNSDYETEDLGIIIPRYLDLLNIVKHQYIYNEQWFSLSLEVIKSDTILDNYGNSNKNAFHGENGYYKDNIDWNDYWFNYYEQNISK
ncbi:MAG: hypothetical protein LBM03_00380 [Erysipelotrichaceae bacterium]|jgi:hypothetical protein|nr:hypothetical protein [Erysipelotrichaceae bacterium]